MSQISTLNMKEDIDTSSKKCLQLKLEAFWICRKREFCSFNFLEVATQALNSNAQFRGKMAPSQMSQEIKTTKLFQYRYHILIIKEHGCLDQNGNESLFLNLQHLAHFQAWITQGCYDIKWAFFMSFLAWKYPRPDKRLIFVGLLWIKQGKSWVDTLQTTQTNLTTTNLHV